MRVSESAWPDGECVQEVSHVTCHVTSVPCMGGSGSDPVRHRKRSQPDPNQTGPQRGSGFRPSARTGPGSGLGSGEYGLRTRLNRTVATITRAYSALLERVFGFSALQPILQLQLVWFTYPPTWIEIVTVQKQIHFNTCSSKLGSGTLAEV